MKQGLSPMESILLAMAFSLASNAVYLHIEYYCMDTGMQQTAHNQCQTNDMTGGFQ